MINIEFFQETAALSRAAAADFLAAGNAAIREKGGFKVALSGGRGPRGLFVELSKAQGLDWSKVELYWVDERWVPWEDPESNFGEVQRLWVDALDVKPALFPMWSPGASPEDGARQYQALLEQRLGPGGFDWCQLGMGPDGHTASLFPGQAALKEGSRNCLVAAHPQSGQPRVTLSLSWINASQKVVFLVTGPDKSEKLGQIARGGSGLPAALVQPSSGQLRWLAERA